ncbi:MAG: proline--tRNA ligase [Flavobacteriales bacterium]|jgi:prolyl-tRNA synthetase|nr:proline--tRNA ligase [Flavobacteriales bacterium]
MAKKLTPRNEDYSKWYNEIVVDADLAQHSDVKGCMVIKPYGYAIWERMKDVLDGMFKETGHMNAYFPLFIPKSYLSKEAAHVEGFAKECAVVTHYRLKNDPNGGGLIVDPDAKLDEELIVRPTSETIIWNTYRKWIQSYRDLPLLINQWANVVRWEMRTRLFLRTTEFLWQEGHTAHETEQEAQEETRQMLEIYAKFTEGWMAMPVIKGNKTESERFAGALDTLCIEAMMQDGKALQAGTSHFLGQNFARAFDVKFATKEGKQELVWATSWGVSTRLMGALVMTHSDDAGLVLPPKLAPIEVVIVPIYKGQEQMDEIVEKCKEIESELRGAGIRVKLDADDSKRSGWKFAEYELKGVPLRLAVGPRDLEKNSCELARRDTRTKSFEPLEGIAETIKTLLDTIQSDLFTSASERLTSNTVEVDDWDDFKKQVNNGQFVMAHWDGTSETEDLISQETKASIRCLPFDGDLTPGSCIKTGNPSARRVLFAKAY